MSFNYCKTCHGQGTLWQDGGHVGFHRCNFTGIEQPPKPKLADQLKLAKDTAYRAIDIALAHIGYARGEWYDNHRNEIHALKAILESLDSHSQ